MAYPLFRAVGLLLEGRAAATAPAAQTSRPDPSAGTKGKTRADRRKIIHEPTQPGPDTTPNVGHQLTSRVPDVAKRDYRAHAECCIRCNSALFAVAHRQVSDHDVTGSLEQPAQKLDVGVGDPPSPGAPVELSGDRCAQVGPVVDAELGSRVVDDPLAGGSVERTGAPPISLASWVCLTPLAPSGSGRCSVR